MVFDIVRDEEGYLWLATEEGLMRFDGNKFRIINEENTEGLFSGTFYDLAPSANNGIWAASKNTVLFIDKKTVKSFDFRKYTKGAYINCIAEDQSGTLWVAMNNGSLYRIRNNTTIEKFRTWIYEGMPIHVLHPTAGHMLVGTDQGLFKILLQTDQVSTLPEFGSLMVRSLVVDDQGSMWIGTKDKGLFYKKENSVISYTKKDGLKQLYITSLSIDQEGKLWIGTGGSGLQVFANDRFTEVKESNSLYIRKIHVDKTGMIWLGTLGAGLVQMKHADIQMLSLNHKLSGNVILPIYEHTNGDIWIGTAGRGVNRISQGYTTQFNSANGLSNDIVLSIYGTEDAIFIGTSNGLNKYNLKTQKIDKHYTVKDGLKSNDVQVVFYDSEKILWIATKAGGLHKLIGNQTFETVNLHTYPWADFICIYEDKNKNIWLGTDGSGLFKLSRKREIKHYLNLPTENIYSIFEDPEGDIWLGTDLGLLCFNEDQSRLFNKRNGLSFNQILSIMEDDMGYIWTGGNAGIQRISLNDLMSAKKNPDKGVQIPAKLFNTSNGMANAEVNGGIFPPGWKMRNGNLWLPTVEGVAVVNPRIIDKTQININLKIQSIKFGEEERNIFEDINIPPGVYNIEIEYSGIDFESPHTINYYYRLVGLENEWQPAENRRVAYFTSLNPGKYTFEVKAEQFGTWSDPQHLSFEVKPFFYQTSWFKTFLVLVLFGAGFFAKQYHTKFQQEAKLKKMVDNRTRELQELNERLYAAIKDIETQNNNLKEIAWTQSHLVRAPLARIIGLINILQHHYTKEENIEELLSYIKDAGEELDSIIKEIVRKAEGTYENKPE